MFKIVPFLFLFLIACQPKKSTSESQSVPPYSIALEDLEGNTIELKSKITLVNLWATWCKPCIVEMPDLEKMQKQLPDSIQLILASDEPLERQIKFIEKQSFDLEFVQLTSSMEELGVYALPTTLILDSNGNILETMVGAKEWNTPSQIRQITSYLK